MEKRYVQRFKNFLDSGTPNAQAIEVALCILAVASLPVLVFMAAVMGNVVQVFKQFKTAKRFNASQVRSSVNHLRREKFIEYITDKNGKTIVKITKKGKSKLREFDIELMSIKKQKKWDKKWRLVMYDLPIRFRKAREALRWKLKELGFYQFQKSAWIYPYPCEDEIIFIADFYGVRSFVGFLIVSDISREETMKKYFNLG